MTHALATAALEASSRHVASGAGAAIFIVYLIIVVVSIVAAVKVLAKAGYSGWWVLVALVPLLNVIMLLVFAFSEWPVVREVKALRAQLSSRSGYGPPPGYGGLGGPPPPPSPGFGSVVPPPEEPSGERPLPRYPSAGEGGGVTGPGWYPTPDGRLRYWDGTAWTDHYA